MHRRLSIACKGKDIGQPTLGLHLLQLLFKRNGHLLTGRQRFLGAMVGIEATLAINTIESTYLAVGRQQVNSQRNAQSPAVYRTENG